MKRSIFAYARPAVLAVTSCLLAACATVHGGPQDYKAAQAALSQHIQTLSSEEYGGRMPGTEGGAKTEQYIVDALQKAGLQPGAGDGSWRQPVTLVRYSPGAARLEFVRDKATIGFSGDQVLATGRQREWKDLPAEYIVGTEGALREGLLKGKAAVIPAVRLREAFNAIGPASAEAVIVLTDDQAEFDRLRPLLERGRWQLRDAPDEAARASYVLLSPEASARMAKQWSLDLAAVTEGPMRATQLPGGLALTVTPQVETIETHNVIGKLPGKQRDSGAVMMLAHWDHLGTCGPPEAEDRLCNGAVDNASGIGAMIEVAKRISARGALDRDLYVMGTTAEELGLLGAEAFANDPPFALPTLVAAFNMDTIAIAPRGAPATVIGWGRTPLDAGITEVAAKLGTRLDVKEEHQQFVRRQDGWALLSRDVPSVLVSSSFGDEEAFASFLGGPYHRHDDEWRPDLELGGATDDIFLHIALLQYFGSVASYQPGAAKAEE